MFGPWTLLDYAIINFKGFNLYICNYFKRSTHEQQLDSSNYIIIYKSCNPDTSTKFYSTYDNFSWS